MLPMQDCIQILKNETRGVLSVLGDDDYPYGIHKEFFTECFKDVGLEFEANRKVVCEEFQVVYK